MRKAFSLVELLIVLAVLTSVSAALAPAFTTLLGDIPRSYRVAQENTRLLGMLEQMRKDIDTARQLPESFAGSTTDEKLLLIELADGVIAYQLKNGQMLRRPLTGAGQGGEPDATVWSLPHAKVEWQVWKKDDKGYAVEIKTCIEYEIRGRCQKKMANSHLYFVGAFSEGLK